MCWRAQERRRGAEAPAGSAHIQQHCASLVNAFCADALNPYANFHRPCFFPEAITDAKGKEYKRYRYEDMNTPYEKRKSLSSACQRLEPGVTVEHLDAIALQIRDKATSWALDDERRTLFQAIAGTIRKQARTKPARQHVH